MIRTKGRRVLDRIIAVDDYEPLARELSPILSWRSPHHQTAPLVEAVDTTGAEDAFGAALAWSLAEGVNSKRRSGWRTLSERSTLGPSALGAVCRLEASWSVSSGLPGSPIRPQES